ncbi:TAT-variant-translocated molybdopterin oxidoreductase [Tunturiibacter gelidoferens]|uniref:Molybdopterin-containing oxidoreductase family iron-sulfur binding subunit n=1 Tax=Tunturiibacter gelidiferens TaxID=3069689 RepID=A0ACC5P1M1_9BACT|nr:TAT-variant-translocated molybdopterin oxidoreductase [Edaphobacter lichenicola]MBB5340601.1 molybdopterin-containing oxidoreductase family iron-sulfur binding subunit [Edaphobacter lichenicola]
MKTTGNQTGTDETMAEMRAPEGQPVVVTQIAPAKMTLAEVHAKLDGKTGRRFWKNLDELADTPAFQELMQEEFPRQAGAGEWVDAVSRRGFLKVMGASLALAGLAGCTKQPDEPIFPYIKQPEDLVLGKPMYFATAYPFPTGAIPVLVKSDSFRPIKVDGNPEHPMSRGKSDAFTQATLLDLYDPDRSQHVLHRGEVSSWGEFQQAFATAAKKTSGGQGIYFLSETITSPTLAAQWKQVQAAYPQAKMVQWEPVNQDSSRAASKAAFGSYTDAQYKLEEADVILSLDADFLGGIAHPGFLPLASGYAERHRYEEGKTMNRLYVVETMPTVTGFKAEHRLALKPSEIATFAQALATGSAPQGATAEQQKFFAALSADLKSAGGKCVVIPGEQASPAVHAAAYALNSSLGAVGKTVIYTETVNPMPSEQVADLKSLVADMKAGKVQWLVMLGVNPIYSGPWDLGFRDAFANVPVTVQLASHVDETGAISNWHINKAHYLESWSDARAYDGTISIIQPMIDPMYGGKSAHDVLQALLADPQQSAYDVVVANAKTYIKGDFATSWRKALHDGWVEGTAFTAKAGGAGKSALASFPAAAAPSGLEVSFRPDPSIYDGRFANVGWLQELPKQVTSLSWDNAAIMSINTLADLKLDESDPVKISLNGREVVAPAMMIPGHPDGVITVHLGFGRGVEAGRVGQGVGFDAYQIRTTDGLLSVSGATAKKVPGTYDLCITKVHNIEHRGSFAQHDLEKPLSDKDGVYSLAGHEAEERSIIRYATLDEVKKNPNFAHEGGASGTLIDKVGYSPQGEKVPHDNSFFPDNWNYEKQDPSTLKIQNAWGMAIDLNSCIGCNACIVSCYAENNIPVIGREQVKVGRNMQWLRIDTYFEGDLHAPKAHFQPMACQHCENAGCEQVCPVGATVHTPEGLNTMVYNRCVGTRYCSNNCPYKVRKFNFLLYSDYDTESLKFMRNPDVSVRSRGVMEKCSYCVQRIEAAKITADKENREIRDGEIVTACQQACPTSAITFGNINDKASKVAKMKAEERDYQVLADLNFRPRTTYTAGVINPHPELA